MNVFILKEWEKFDKLNKTSLAEEPYNELFIGCRKFIIKNWDSFKHISKEINKRMKWKMWLTVISQEYKEVTEVFQFSILNRFLTVYDCLNIYDFPSTNLCSDTWHYMEGSKSNIILLTTQSSWLAFLLKCREINKEKLRCINMCSVLQKSVEIRTLRLKQTTFRLPITQRWRSENGVQGHTLRRAQGSGEPHCRDLHCVSKWHFFVVIRMICYMCVTKS